MPTVIKADEQNPAFVKRLETVDLSDHLAEAKLVVKAARAKARAVLERTRVEADALREQATQEGYEAGFRRGYEAGARAGYQSAFEEAQRTFATDQANLVQAATDMIDTYERMKRDLFITARQDMLEFAAKVAERVTRQIGVVNREAATANLEAALELVESRTDLVVRINPLDQTTVEQFAGQLQERAERARNISLVVDESIAPGGCSVATQDTEVDATLDTQIEQITRLVVGRPPVTS